MEVPSTQLSRNQLLWFVPSVIAVVFAVWFFQREPAVPMNAPHVSDAGRQAAIARLHQFLQSQHPDPAASEMWTDDGGFMLGLLFFPSQVSDATSLQSIRDSFQGATQRGRDLIESELAKGKPTAVQRLDLLLTLAKLQLFDGDAVKAETGFAKAREFANRGGQSLGGRLPEIIYLQGVAAFRRGETENCIECRGEGSCVFPIAPTALHTFPNGSRRAADFFAEYLELVPTDLGARWLLNLARMTVGEYPAKVSAKHKIPIEPFDSEFDIGRFKDVAAKAGVNRLNQAGGAIMDDFDNDGWLDLVTTSMDTAASMAFYRNRGNGSFEDRTAAARLTEQIGGLNCVQTDFNNDGWLDIFIVRGAWTGVAQRPSLLRNERDGSFKDVTREAGLLVPIDSQVAAWADFDNDGWLDLFVGGERHPSRLFRNQGDGTFADVTESARVVHESLVCKGAAWGDFNNDRFPDLYVANHRGRPALFRNNRNGTFTDIAELMGLTGPTTGFSCWVWDYDNDGWLDVFATAYERSLNENIRSHLKVQHTGESGRLLRNRDGGGFENVTARAGLDLAMAPMGSNIGDFDNDGFLDFFLGTGTPRYSMLVPNRMFRNVAGVRFADVTTSTGTGNLQKGHGVACGDFDRDGDIDIFVQHGGATPGDMFYNALYQNPGAGGRSITLKLIGKKTNRAAIGARIKVTLAGSPSRVIHRLISSGSSFGANSLEQTIGFGTAPSVESVEIHWPTSDQRQVFGPVASGQFLEITESESVPRVVKPVPTAK